ncbi:hypothetical protein NP233_g9059 [Leucocoprinus birnbaumii]|uniref:glutathione transferase n=1 Tax=Leucocoprinus birnbaumii TaxID=56174 RepID=A0AAD5VL93_9AGAR|nr:hypothetical protein NP233_g9059 [Leucocoprinus birnbaumii]
MPLKLYGWRGSSPAHLVAIILHEKQIPYEWVEVDLPKGEHKALPFTNVNPFGEVPAIDDNGFVLYESRAIARYLDEKYPNQGIQLYPQDLQKRAIADQAAWAELWQFYRYGATIVFEVFNKGLFGLATDLAIIAEAKKTIIQKMDIYEGILSKQKYLAGDELTLADIGHIPIMGRLVEEVRLELGAGRPNVQRWIDELLSRESWRVVKQKYIGLV